MEITRSSEKRLTSKRLDFGMPLRFPIQIRWPGNPTHNTQPERRVVMIGYLDQMLFTNEWAPKAALAAIWRARDPARDDDDDNRSAGMVGLDAFVQGAAAANRAALNLADYLNALYVRSNELREHNLARNFTECAIIGALATARMGNLTDMKASRIFDGVRDQNTLEITLDPGTEVVFLFNNLF